MTLLEPVICSVEAAPPAALLLDAYAARSCPVKTQNAFDPRLTVLARPADDRLAELFEGGLAFEMAVLDRWATLPGVVDLRPWAGTGWSEQAQRCGEAMRAGASVIIKGRLPVDLAGARVGSPDVLVRGPDQPHGRPGYRAVEIKWHKIIEADRPPRDDRPREDRPPRSVWWSALESPTYAARSRIERSSLRLHARQGDFLQLAHYQRMLEAAGYAAGGAARAAVVGTDDLPDRGLVWVDLDRPLLRTFSRSTAEGWRLRSLLDRYDHEHRFRVDIATVARQQTGRPELDPPLLVRPIVVAECARCPWWEHCRPQLPGGDLSLRIDKGPLDPREIVTLRRLGIDTVSDLAQADVEELLPAYLPEVTHRSSAETRLRAAARRARMLLDGISLERETEGPIEVPGGDLEIDVDIETSVDGRVYLWGFRVDDGHRPPTTRQFSRFTDLASGAELALAREALGWLHDQVLGAATVRVYHYSAFEVATIRVLADRCDDPLLSWAATYAEREFVDLLEIVKQHYFGVSGLGLKAVAREAGFGWRDDDPGGLNSQLWFADAVHGDSASIRSAARRRVLEYNEDDVIATSRLRAWLRAQ